MMNKTVNSKFKRIFKNMPLKRLIISTMAWLYFFPITTVAQQDDHKQRIDNITHLGIKKTYIGIGKIADFPCGEVFGMALQDASRYILSTASSFNATLVPGSDHEFIIPEDGIGENKTLNGGNIFKENNMSYSKSFNRIKNLKVGVIDGFYGKRWAIAANQLRENYATNAFDVRLEGKVETAFDYSPVFHEMIISIQQLSKENELLKDRLASIEERLNIPEDPRVLHGSDKRNQIEITPNPVSKGQIIINYQLLSNDIKKAELKITDLNGRTIQVFKLSTTNTNTLQVEEIDLSAGVYFYQLVCDGQKEESRKLIVQ